jgi:putative transposase
MAKKSHTPEQIISKLREAEVLVSQGATLAIVLKKIGVSDCTYYRWRQEYGGMRIDQAKRLKDLEIENVRLKKLVAELSLDKAILTEAARGNF